MTQFPTIVLVGPESTGKSTLAAQLAQKLGGTLVLEYAREYLNGLGRKYTEEDLVQIAKGQHQMEADAAKSAIGPLICDTDVVSVKIWAEYRFRRVDPAIDALIQPSTNRIYLLTGIDLPWEFDPLRENPNDREQNLQYQIEVLNRLRFAWTAIHGFGDQRLVNALKAVDYA